MKFEVWGSGFEGVVLSVMTVHRMEVGRMVTCWEGDGRSVVREGCTWGTADAQRGYFGFGFGFGFGRL